MTTYTISVDIAYEGRHEAFRGTEVEIIEWFRNGRDGYNLEDITIYSNDGLDPYEINAKAFPD